MQSYKNLAYTASKKRFCQICQKCQYLPKICTNRRKYILSIIHLLLMSRINTIKYAPSEFRLNCHQYNFWLNLSNIWCDLKNRSRFKNWHEYVKPNKGFKSSNLNSLWHTHTKRVPIKIILSPEIYQFTP